jgi:hypothetical protein
VAVGPSSGSWTCLIPGRHNWFHIIRPKCRQLQQVVGHACRLGKTTFGKNGGRQCLIGLMSYRRLSGLTCLEHDKQLTALVALLQTTA